MGLLLAGGNNAAIVAMRKIFEIYMRHVKGARNSCVMNAMMIPFEVLNGIIILCRDFCYNHGLLKVTEPPLPLISVGNLSYGGTNKTPFVEMLARYMTSKNLRAGIVSRGYTGKSQDVILLNNCSAERELTGDEPLLLSQSLGNVPVAVAKKRIDGVIALKNSGVEIAIADDAFQHRSLARDVDIVLIDCACPFGSGKLIPNGILREKISGLTRASMVVLTKSNHVSREKLLELENSVAKYIPREKIFTSSLEIESWLKFGNDSGKALIRVFAFSAIGSPESFRKSLEKCDLTISAQKIFQDHHRYTQKDLDELITAARDCNSDALTCTEKDLYNMPENWREKFSQMPLIVPKIKIEIHEPQKFFGLLRECLQPRIIVASNGYGEDSIGVILAKKLRKKFPDSKIFAFPLVGKGDAYLKAGFDVKSAPSVTPSGGVLKYSLRDLWGDMRAGLLRHVANQLRDWQNLSGKIRTPICVGDVYLLIHTLFGSGMRPLFAATAKTVYLSGHWRSEKFIINSFTQRTWTRDLESARQLGGKAVYSGSPIMDLLFEAEDFESELESGYESENLILLLPGSRLRACKDVELLLNAALILREKISCDFRMVLAPTLPMREFLESCESYGWKFRDNSLERDGVKIRLTNQGIARAASAVKILLGLGGTANQLCAGLGIPVVSIDEKGKRVQKKLLGDSEILVNADSKSLAECVLRILSDRDLYEFMSNAGRARMGSPGALDDIVNFACNSLGWDIKEKIYLLLKSSS